VYTLIFNDYKDIKDNIDNLLANSKNDEICIFFTYYKTISLFTKYIDKLTYKLNNNETFNEDVVNDLTINIHKVSVQYHEIIIKFKDEFITPVNECIKASTEKNLCYNAVTNELSEALMNIALETFNYFGNEIFQLFISADWDKNLEKLERKFSSLRNISIFKDIPRICEYTENIDITKKLITVIYRFQEINKIEVIADGEKSSLTPEELAKIATNASKIKVVSNALMIYIPPGNKNESTNDNNLNAPLIIEDKSDEYKHLLEKLHKNIKNICDIVKDSVYEDIKNFNYTPMETKEKPFKADIDEKIKKVQEFVNNKNDQSKNYLEYVKLISEYTKILNEIKNHNNFEQIPIAIEKAVKQNECISSKNKENLHKAEDYFEKVIEKEKGYLTKFYEGLKSIIPSKTPYIAAGAVGLGLTGLAANAIYNRFFKETVKQYDSMNDFYSDLSSILNNQENLSKLKYIREKYENQLTKSQIDKGKSISNLDEYIDYANNLHLNIRNFR
jgi:hypothetical protein